MQRKFTVWHPCLIIEVSSLTQFVNGMPDNLKKTYDNMKVSKLRREVVSAARLLTRIPLGQTSETYVDLAEATWSFPVIGATVGIAGGTVFAISVAIGLPSFLAAAISLGSTILLTGGLHEDGLADTVDAIGGGLTHCARLKIMHDSCTGTYGTLALIFSLVLRAGALVALTDVWLVVMALIAAGSLSRGILPWIMSRVPLASKTGVAAAVGTPSNTIAAAAGVAGCVLAIICLGITTGLLVIVLSIFIAWVGSQLAYGFFGGYNGDLLGAVQQTIEIMVLLVTVAMI